MKWYNKMFDWLEILFAFAWAIFCLLGLMGGFYVSCCMIRKLIC